VPPLSRLGEVSVAKAEQGIRLVDGGHGLEVAPVDVGAEVVAPGGEKFRWVAHRLAVDRDDIVEPAGQVGRAPRNDLGHAALLSAHPITAGSTVDPVQPRSAA
jgi:hypothetical protein